MQITPAIIIQNDMCLEEYFSSVYIKKFRDALIRFEFGINELKANTSYQNMQDLFCPFCYQIEDERHFLLSCHAYDDLRKKYLTWTLGRRPSTRLCCSVMQDTDATKTRLLAMYIYYALNHRENTLQIE